MVIRGDCCRAAERPATTESSPAAMERLSAPARRQAGGDRQVSGILVCHRAERQVKRLVSPLIVHNKAAGRYSRKYKPIEINNAMYPIARNFVVNIAVLFAPSCVIYNL